MTDAQGDRNLLTALHSCAKVVYEDKPGYQWPLFSFKVSVRFIDQRLVATIALVSPLQERKKKGKKILQS